MDARFPVQYVVRPYKEDIHDYRGYAGRVAGGTFKPGDSVIAFPAEIESTIQTIDVYTQERRIRQLPATPAIISLADAIDISRGSLISHVENKPKVGQEISLMVCWFNERPLTVGNKYIIRHTASEAKCIARL